ncbi:MAG: LeuA family protein [Thermoplasmatota archaeon]
MALEINPDELDRKVHSDKYWLSEYNWRDSVTENYNLPEKVDIHDATIREGQQTPGIVFREDEQVRIARALDELGVSRIEVVPIISDEDKEATKKIVKEDLDAEIISFVSWNKDDIDVALECDLDSVLLDYVGNPWQGRAFWDLEPEEIVEKGVETAQYAKDHGLDVSALIWDDFKAPEEFLELNYTSIVEEGGAKAVSLADTYGFSTPWAMKEMVERIKGWVPNTPVELHIHNDFGMSTAQALSGVAGGAEIIDTAMLGLGERCGNVPTEEIAMVLELIMDVDTGINLDKIYSTGKLVQKIAKFDIGPRKPMLGRNAFKYSSGWIHWMQSKAEEGGELQGMLPYMPEVIGHPGREFVIDKSVGGGLLNSKLEEMGIDVPDKETLAEIVKEVKKESTVIKGSLDKHEIKKIAEEVISRK